jgi:hypothetical protein
VIPDRHGWYGHKPDEALDRGPMSALRTPHLPSFHNPGPEGLHTAFDWMRNNYVGG